MHNRIYINRITLPRRDIQDMSGKHVYPLIGPIEIQATYLKHDRPLETTLALTQTQSEALVAALRPIERILVDFWWGDD